MNDTTTTETDDLSSLTKEQKEEMNWKMAHSLLLVAHEMLTKKLERGEDPEAADYMTPIGIACACLGDEYPAEELCRMMSALAAMMRVKDLMKKQAEQDQQQGDNNVH